MDFVVQANRRVKLKESEKRDKYMDLARELKKLWKIEMTVIQIVIGALGTVIKGLALGNKSTSRDRSSVEIGKNTKNNNKRNFTRENLDVAKEGKP